MRHRMMAKSLQRDTQERQALLKGLVRSLIEKGEIVTTLAKAKEVRRLVNKLISRAQTDSIARRRQLHRFLGKRDAVNTLVERVAPKLNRRKTGFVTLTKLPNRRGDNASMACLALVEKPEHLGSLRRPGKVTTEKPTAKKKQVTKKMSAIEKKSVIEKKQSVRKKPVSKTASKSTK